MKVKHFIGGYRFSHKKVCPLVTIYWEILCSEQFLTNFSQDWDLVLQLGNYAGKKHFKWFSWMWTSTLHKSPSELFPWESFLLNEPCCFSSLWYKVSHFQSKYSETQSGFKEARTQTWNDQGTPISCHRTSRNATVLNEMQSQNRTLRFWIIFFGN